MKTHKKSWSKVKELVEYRKFRQSEDNVQTTREIKPKSEEKQELVIDKPDPWLFELLTSPRYADMGNTESWLKNPDILKRLGKKMEITEKHLAVKIDVKGKEDNTSFIRKVNEENYDKQT